jgi:PTH1 family peptidyl-tRNA hydrolase
MNLSGLAAAHLCGYYRFAPENLVVLHDELDLPLGAGAGQARRGQRRTPGPQFSARELGTPGFHARAPGHRPAGAGARPVKAYVLERFTQAERAVAEDIAADAAALVELLLAQDWTRPPVRPPDRPPAGGDPA